VAHKTIAACAVHPEIGGGLETKRAWPFGLIPSRPITAKAHSHLAVAFVSPGIIVVDSGALAAPQFVAMALFQRESPRRGFAARMPNLSDAIPTRSVEKSIVSGHRHNKMCVPCPPRDIKIVSFMHRF